MKKLFTLLVALTSFSTAYAGPCENWTTTCWGFNVSSVDYFLDTSNPTPQPPTSHVVNVDYLSFSTKALCVSAQSVYNNIESNTQLNNRVGGGLTTQWYRYFNATQCVQHR